MAKLPIYGPIIFPSSWTLYSNFWFPETLLYRCVAEISHTPYFRFGKKPRLCGVRRDGIQHPKAMVEYEIRSSSVWISRIFMYSDFHWVGIGVWVTYVLTSYVLASSPQPLLSAVCSTAPRAQNSLHLTNGSHTTIQAADFSHTRDSPYMSAVKFYYILLRYSKNPRINRQKVSTSPTEPPEPPAE